MQEQPVTSQSAAADGTGYYGSYNIKRVKELINKFNENYLETLLLDPYT